MSSSTGQFNTKSPTIKRILREHKDLTLSPSSSYSASPVDSNLFLWHFTLAGPPASPYSEGIYHGRIDLPPTYPLRPPSFRFLTPSGRFEVNRDICLSISGHHEESWQPAWGIRTALVALRAFMESDARGQVGGMEMSKAERERLAKESRGWVCRDCGARNEELLLKDGGEKAATSAEDEKVPDELKLGYRDELASKDSSSSASDQALKPTPTVASSSTSQGQPAPPQPRTLPIAQSLTSQSSQRTAPSPRPAPPQPGAVPVPSATVSAAQGSEEATPPWLDKAIVGVAAMLGFMLFKKAFGIELI